VLNGLLSLEKEGQALFFFSNGGAFVLDLLRLFGQVVEEQSFIEDCRKAPGFNHGDYKACSKLFG